jgi:hypothetical protein
MPPKPVKLIGFRQIDFRNVHTVIKRGINHRTQGDRLEYIGEYLSSQMARFEGSVRPGVSRSLNSTLRQLRKLQKNPGGIFKSIEERNPYQKERPFKHALQELKALTIQAQVLPKARLAVTEPTEDLQMRATTLYADFLHKTWDLYSTLILPEIYNHMIENFQKTGFGELENIGQRESLVRRYCTISPNEATPIDLSAFSYRILCHVQLLCDILEYVDIPKLDVAEYFRTDPAMYYFAGALSDHRTRTIRFSTYIPKSLSAPVRVRHGTLFRILEEWIHLCTTQIRRSESGSVNLPHMRLSLRKPPRQPNSVQVTISNNQGHLPFDLRPEWDHFPYLEDTEVGFYTLPGKRILKGIVDDIKTLSGRVSLENRVGLKTALTFELPITGMTSSVPKPAV